MAEWVWIIFLQLVAYTEASNSHGRLGNVSSILSFKKRHSYFSNSDIIGITQCDALGGQTTPSNSGDSQSINKYNDLFFR